MLTVPSSRTAASRKGCRREGESANGSIALECVINAGPAYVLSFRLAQKLEDVPSGQFESRTRSSSRFKGVSWHKVARKWIAQISSKKAQVSLGTFTDEAAAGAAFDKAALLVRGRETVLNFSLSNYLDADGAIIEDRGIKERLEKRGWVQFLSPTFYMLANSKSRGFDLTIFVIIH